MSVNTTIGMSPEKVKRFGELFGTIDFDVVEHPSKQQLDRFGNDTIAGKFHIGGKEFQLTLAELDRIVETCNIAKTVFFQKYRFNR
jgi:hypothetical protein